MELDQYYLDWLNRLLVDGQIETTMSVLVLCGTQLDAEVFNRLGFNEVTVSNLDERHEGTWSTGAKWDRQNAEELSYADTAFDLVAVHSGLHHCRLPQKALYEMYRVARKGVLVMEPCENLMVKVGRFLGVGQEYEVHAVADNGLVSGGIHNTSVPNYVYRWSPAEVQQATKTFAPEFRHRIAMHSYLIVHWHDLLAKKNKLKLLLMLGLFIPLKLLSFVMPRLGNVMGFYIQKPDRSALHPWLENQGDGVVPNRKWFEQHLRVEPSCN